MFVFLAPSHLFFISTYLRILTFWMYYDLPNYQENAVLLERVETLKRELEEEKSRCLTQSLFWWLKALRSRSGCSRMDDLQIFGACPTFSSMKEFWLYELQQQISTLEAPAIFYFTICHLICHFTQPWSYIAHILIVAILWFDHNSYRKCQYECLIAYDVLLYMPNRLISFCSHSSFRGQIMSKEEIDCFDRVRAIDWLIVID